MTNPNKLADALITHEQATEAVDAMDDCAKMDVSVDPFGPRSTLERYIAQQLAIDEYDAQPAPGECNVEGSWLWRKLMDWCKQQRIAPATQNALFAIAGEAHKLYVAPQPAPAPVQVDDLDAEPGLPWRDISECESSDDLYWFMRGDVIDGPRNPTYDDPDYWSHFAPCEAPPFNRTAHPPAPAADGDCGCYTETTWADGVESSVPVSCEKHAAADGAGEHVATLEHILKHHYDYPGTFSMERAALLAAIAALRQTVPDDVKRDSDRWRALLSCARIRIMGWAGFNDDSPSRVSAPNYRHFEAGFWTQHDAGNQPSNAADTLIAFADAAIASQQESRNAD